MFWRISGGLRIRDIRGLRCWNMSDNTPSTTAGSLDEFPMTAAQRFSLHIPISKKLSCPNKSQEQSMDMESATWGCSWAYQWLQYYNISIIYIYYIYDIMYELCIYVYTVRIYIYIYIYIHNVYNIYIYCSHGDNLHKLGYICININVPVKKYYMYICDHVCVY